jgi:hypothetical protein
MAVPFYLKRGETQHNIPTWGVGRHTKVWIKNTSTEAGQFSITAGVGPTESLPVNPKSEVRLERNFGGFPVTVKNESPNPTILEVVTE